ncbi:MAG TPA: 3-isopropylmalate dehydrogenase [Clostridiales bacterium]|nr:3-isopropylmalate dehydrogenase [Clostridiales bacterium]
MEKKITVLKGDGIGPEIVAEAIKALNQIATKYGHRFHYTEADIGGAAIDGCGVPVSEETLDLCKKSDSILLGAVGGPQWDCINPDKRPEKGLLKVRKALGLFANLRPTKLFPQLAAGSPLRQSTVENGIDLLIVRELTGGIYYGERFTGERNDERYASDLMAYSAHEIERIGRVAFETARKRRHKVTSVDKANVLDSSKLWRTVMHELAVEYSDIEFEDALVDSTAMQLINDPSRFDVIVTENMFGDILSDEASMLSGSLGMMPSASLSESKLGMYEPIHGSAPDIAGKNLANPLGTILSAAMMLRYAFDLEKEAGAIEAAVNKTLNDGYRTVDIMSEGMKKVSCSEMGDLVAANL